MIVFGGDYEHTLAVSSSRNGFDLEYRPLDLASLFAKVLRREEFDVCEFSLSNYIMMRDRGADWLTAVPIFPNRAFRHGTMLVRRDDPIESFAELAGKRVGIADYTMTGGVWGRGVLADEYGLHWSHVDWVSTDTPRFPPPAAARVTLDHSDLEDSLANGRLDALFYPSSRDSVLPLSQRRFRPLLRNFRQAEAEYLRKTGIFPINHALILHRETARRHPELPQALVAAYEDSKKQAVQRRLGASFLPWGAAHWSDVMDLFEGDPIPYGLCPANQVVIAKLQNYLVEQQLISRPYALSDLFVDI